MTDSSFHTITMRRIFVEHRAPHLRDVYGMSEPAAREQATKEFNRWLVNIIDEAHAAGVSAIRHEIIDLIGDPRD